MNMQLDGKRYSDDSDHQVDIEMPDSQIFKIYIKNGNKYRAWAIVETDVENKSSADLWYISTHKNFRRKGYATIILDLLKQNHDRIITNIYSIKDEGAQCLIANKFELKKSMFKNQEDVLIWTKSKEQNELP